MRALLVFVVANIAGCYSPGYRDCEVTCESGSCPAGYSCEGGVCRAPGMSGSPCMVTPDAGGDGGGSGLPIEQLFDAQLSAICEYYVRCGSFEDAPTCKSVFGANARLPLDIIDAVNMSKVNYDATKARVCIDAIAKLSCERWQQFGSRPPPPACLETFTGTVAAGGMCAIDEQCVSQECIVPASCTMACCIGNCSPGPAPGPRNVGQSCTSRDTCMGGYCDSFTTVCVQYKMTGVQCNNDFECADALYCNANPTMPNQRSCQAMVGTNGPCSVTNGCAMLSDVCFNGACRTGGLTGAMCQLASGCQPMHPCNNGFCALPPGPGEPCSGGICRDAYCDTVTTPPVCRLRIADGNACNPQFGGSDCTSGYCDSMNHCATPNCF